MATTSHAGGSSNTALQGSGKTVAASHAGESSTASQGLRKTAGGGGFAHRRKQRSFAPGIYVAWPPPRKIRIKMAIDFGRLAQANDGKGCRPGEGFGI
uniref:Uncharacterized protein n=1 Tax=Oryza sativa subsp. japonica TaxID=39947 RepID=Q10JJ7_ORYSJ|nr:hypothetical protein LOC_Os03g30410 [Oryza sativa Japonica Group]